MLTGTRRRTATARPRGCPGAKRGSRGPEASLGRRPKSKRQRGHSEVVRKFVPRL